MSRIGNKPITLPAGVDAKIDGQNILVKGKDCSLNLTVHKDMVVKLDGNVLTVERPSDEKEHKALHGLTRSLINNMVVGVSEGFSKELAIHGVGYKAAKNGKKLVLNLGYSHPIEMEDPEGIQTEVPAPNKIIVKGADKQLVGETAAKIRSCRLPDAYKGKGIRYADEIVHLKEGKTGAKA